MREYHCETFLDLFEACASSYLDLEGTSN